MLKKTIKWGIIGGGNVVETKSGPAFNMISGSSVWAVARRNMIDARQTASKLEATKSYDNYLDLIQDPEVDAVYIATPPGLHKEQALSVALAQKPLYLEKPFARNYAESLEIVQAFGVNQTPLFVSHYRRSLPKFIQIKQLLDSGKIGKVLDVNFVMQRNPKMETKSSASWLYNPELSGGGKFFDIAPHTIDLLVFLFGEFASTSSIVRNTSGFNSVEDLVLFNFETKSGVVGTANFNLNSTQKADKMIIYGTLGKISFSVHGNTPIEVATESESFQVDIKNPDLIELNMISDVVGYLLGDTTKKPCTGLDALETMRIMDEVLEEYYDGRGNGFWENGLNFS